MGAHESGGQSALLLVAMLDWGYDYVRFDPPVRLITGGAEKHTLAAKEQY